MLFESAAFGKALHSAFSWSAGRIAGAAGRQIERLLKERGARRELTKIARRAIERTATVAPALSDGLRSPWYLQNVLAPAMLEMLRDPTRGYGGERLAVSYLDRFVKPYAPVGDLDAVLVARLGMDRDALARAFDGLVEAFREDLYQSKHWRDAIRDSAVEETRLGVLQMVQSSVEPPAHPFADLVAAREDAKAASDGLRSWPQRIYGAQIDRPELQALRERIRETPRATTLLIGSSGAGKSALLAALTQALEADGMTVFAIKADMLPPEVASLADVSRALGMQGDIVREIDALAAAGPVVLVIDQLDAVSEVMDRSSQRMRLLLQLARRWRSDAAGEATAPVHVVVSSRPFEAAHDARFQSLDAHKVTLGLPPYERIEGLLAELGLDPARAPKALRETLRRPFMLKLYVDLARRGEPLGTLVEGELLNAWLASAQLGDDDERAAVLSLMARLAEEMTRTESLWRPADRFAAEAPAALRRAEACELVVRQNGALGFAHQAWLDDFQARTFITGAALAEYAWTVQDGLFGRATLLRGLERQRRLEPGAYAQALDLLLGDPRTRRHLRHLVVDLVASQAEPLPRESGWVQRLVREDPILARRAIAKIVDRWAGWRTALAPLIRGLARDPELSWAATVMSIAEAKHDAAAGEQLLETCWSDETQDSSAFEVCWRAPLWSEAVRGRLAGIFARQTYSPHAVAHYAAELVEHGQAEGGAALVALYLASLTLEKRGDFQLYGLEKVVEAAPGAFARQILPWFAELVQREPEETSGVRGRYPITRILPLDWQLDDEQGSVFTVLQRAMEQVARESPEAFVELAWEYESVEVDEMQALIAQGFAAGCPALAEAAVDWLLSDPRRLQVGLAHVQDDENVGRLLHDWGTRTLLTAASPHVGPARQARLVAAIDAFDPYGDIARHEADPKDRLRMRRYADQSRASLLACLPPEALTPRRRRQVEELCAEEPKISSPRRRMMASFVGSPMNDVQMSRATDDELFRMLDGTHDGAARDLRRFLVGGVGELAQAFGAFAKAHPERAMRLARERFEAGRHERVAGAMIRELGGLESVEAATVVALIRELSERGFASEDFRRDCAWSYDGLARRRKGLEDQDIARLESWLVVDPALIADRTARRKDLDQQNRERNRPKEPSPPAAKLFGRGLGGLSILPQGNYTILSAVAKGLLSREPPAHDAWLSVLERHVLRAEDPQAWTTLLTQFGWSLWWADRSRVAALFEAMAERHPEVLGQEVSHYLWRYRAIIPAAVCNEAVLAWYGADDPAGCQLAGEFAMASKLVDVDDTAMHALADRILAAAKGPAYLGAIFALAAAWRGDVELRAKAHALLLPVARAADDDVARAVASAVDHQADIAADAFTREFLEVVRDQPGLLRACLHRHFIDALQALLLHPGFENLVLEVSEAAANLLLQESPQRFGGLLDQDLVSIAVSLQRNGGALRIRAMDLYERLLDAGVYGADQAAAASLRR